MPSYPWRVPPELSLFVESVEGFDYRLDRDAVHHGLPSTTLTVIIQFDEALDCGWVGDAASDRFWVLAAGLHQRPALIRTHGRQCGIQLALTPFGARALHGRPAAELAGGLVHADDDLPAFPASLHERLGPLTWPERFTVLERHLFARLAAADCEPACPEVREGWRLIIASGGRMPIERVADRVGWSRRHLLNQFRSEFGLTPKQVARLARFERAHRLAEGGTALVDAAYAAGYADQAHLNREWRRLAGRTPTATLAEFPKVQSEPMRSGKESRT